MASSPGSLTVFPQHRNLFFFGHKQTPKTETKSRNYLNRQIRSHPPPPPPPDEPHSFSLDSRSKPSLLRNPIISIKRRCFSVDHGLGQLIPEPSIKNREDQRRSYAEESKTEELLKNDSRSQQCLAPWELDTRPFPKAYTSNKLGSTIVPIRRTVEDESKNPGSFFNNGPKSPPPVPKSDPPPPVDFSVIKFTSLERRPKVQKIPEIPVQISPPPKPPVLTPHLCRRSVSFRCHQPPRCSCRHPRTKPHAPLERSVSLHHHPCHQKPSLSDFEVDAVIHRLRNRLKSQTSRLQKYASPEVPAPTALKSEVAVNGARVEKPCVLTISLPQEKVQGGLVQEEATPERKPSLLSSWNEQAGRVDASLAKLRQEIASLLVQDNSLFLQLLTIRESISDLKRRSHGGGVWGFGCWNGCTDCDESELDSLLDAPLQDGPDPPDSSSGGDSVLQGQSAEEDGLSSLEIMSKKGGDQSDGATEDSQSSSDLECHSKSEDPIAQTPSVSDVSSRPCPSTTSDSDLASSISSTPSPTASLMGHFCSPINSTTMKMLLSSGIRPPFSDLSRNINDSTLSVASAPPTEPRRTANPIDPKFLSESFQRHVVTYPPSRNKRFGCLRELDFDDDVEDSHRDSLNWSNKSGSSINLNVPMEPPRRASTPVDPHRQRNRRLFYQRSPSQPHLPNGCTTPPPSLLFRSTSVTFLPRGMLFRREGSCDSGLDCPAEGEIFV